MIKVKVNPTYFCTDPTVTYLSVTDMILSASGFKYLHENIDPIKPNKEVFEIISSLNGMWEYSTCTALREELEHITFSDKVPQDDVLLFTLKYGI